MSETSESAAIQAIAEVAAEAETRAEIAGDVADMVIENAQERIEEAQETAERIAEAAMQTEIGRRVNALEETVNYTWPAQREELSRQMEALTSLVSDLQSKLAATATVAVTAALSEQSQLTLPQSEEPLAETIAEIQPVIPEALAPVVVEENPAPAPKSKRRWM